MPGYDHWPRWVRISGAVPYVPAPPELKGVTLTYAEQMRKKVWEEYPFNIRKGATDWDPQTRTYPADPTGCCRHKVAWLQQRLGGVPLYGRRTDSRVSGMHCVLWLKRGDFGFVVDLDGIWPEGSAPFNADATHKAYRP